MQVLKFVCLFCLTGMIAASAAAQNSDPDKSDSAGEAVDYSGGPGINVGKELPEIKLMNQEGDEVSIHKMLDSGNVALVFFRSADW